MYKFIIIYFLFFVSCGQANSDGELVTQSSNATIQTISVDEFESKLKKLQNVQLIDVRTPGEFQEGHLKNAINVDYRNENFEINIKKLDKTIPTFVYCLSGGRSASAATQLSEFGFKEVYNMDGGIMKWRNAKKEIDITSAKISDDGMTMDQFLSLVNKDKYVLVDFNAEWCMPCQKMMPILESLAQQKKDKLILEKIDADKNKKLLGQKSITGIPYLELYKNGKLLWKHSGFIDEKTLIAETGL